ncbi:MAG TPA: sigma-70 family RNA polymerase sigma factor [Verrucomicrobiae bacterium]|jgi:RNA polymerase sigma factor (sigma-70 family)
MKPDPEALTTRWTFIRKLAKAECDEESWNEFYQMYEKLVYAVARKLGLKHEEAQDAVQETMHSVGENIRNSTPDPAHGSSKSWLLKTARWRITDQLRKRSGQTHDATAALDDSRRTATIERCGGDCNLAKQYINRVTLIGTNRQAVPNVEGVWEGSFYGALLGKQNRVRRYQSVPDEFTEALPISREMRRDFESLLARYPVGESEASDRRRQHLPSAREVNIGFRCVLAAK